jgi:hypothetical protein
MDSRTTPHPASLHALSMVVAQMNRVADIARKYGIKALCLDTPNGFV